MAFPVEGQEVRRSAPGDADDDEGQRCRPLPAAARPDAVERAAVLEDEDEIASRSQPADQRTMRAKSRADRRERAIGP